MRLLADILEPIVTEILRRRTVRVAGLDGVCLVAGDAIQLPKGFSLLATPNSTRDRHETGIGWTESLSSGPAGGAADGLDTHIVAEIHKRAPECVDAVRWRVSKAACRLRIVGIEPKRRHFTEAEWAVYQDLSPLEGGPDPSWGPR